MPVWVNSQPLDVRGLQEHKVEKLYISAYTGFTFSGAITSYGGAINMSDEIDDLIKDDESSLFQRIASILERAKGDVVRSVNSSMVLAYWLIGREIVQEMQSGEERAEYGQQIV